jgi:hypothetical protein
MPKVREYDYNASPSSTDAITFTNVATDTTEYTTFGNVIAGGAVVAGDTAFTPAGSIAATDVQAAIEELDAEKVATGDLTALVGGVGIDIAGDTISADRPTATITGTSDTLAAGDDGYINLYTAAGAVTVTLANIATDFECVLIALGAGGLNVATGGMSYANSFTPKKTIAQGEALWIKQTAASTFVIVGGTSA